MMAPSTSKPTSFVQIGVASGATAAGICKYTIRAHNTTDCQARTGQCHFSINNKAGNETAMIGTVINEAVDVTDGSLTLTGFTTDATPTKALIISSRTLAPAFRVMAGNFWSRQVMLSHQFASL
jgi:hypothetical protein